MLLLRVSQLVLLAWAIIRQREMNFAVLLFISVHIKEGLPSLSFY